MRFWDSSAIMPLLVGEAMTAVVRKLILQDRSMSVWWGSDIECVSAISRLERDRIDPQIIRSALKRLTTMREDWNEISPGSLVRDTAKRLLRVHPLRAADSLQLAAAVVLADGDSSSVEIVSLDDRLREAANREGFVVLPHG